MKSFLAFVEEVSKSADLELGATNTVQTIVEMQHRKVEF
jgi:hypothetical protein